MAKLSVAVGEDFPVEERGRDDACVRGRDRRHPYHPHHRWHEFWHRHFAKRRGDAPAADRQDAARQQDQDKKE
jgi:hypothetical protein